MWVLEKFWKRIWIQRPKIHQKQTFFLIGQNLCRPVLHFPKLSLIRVTHRLPSSRLLRLAQTCCHKQVWFSEDVYKYFNYVLAGTFICVKDSAPCCVPAASCNTVKTAARDSRAFAAVLTTITLTRNRASRITNSRMRASGNPRHSCERDATSGFETDNL